MVIGFDMLFGQKKIKRNFKWKFQCEFKKNKKEILKRKFKEKF